ncbi:MAG: UDP-N-acetylglucosamine 4,6-dehydratase (inverting) [Planctomycetes bacterium]|nr:UDP-N-acetylglucosamine 4,6-dehydratase (inverting) [Planctomycetota bacterium]
MLDDRSILVTGGTGSFGRALVREILARHKPRRLVVFSRDEQKQFRMAQELRPEDHPALRYFIGDVRDKERLLRAFDGIDFVVHAAAMKHVPIAEYNPFEVIRTNVGGAENVINAAIDRGVERVIALSTDKAASPINLYGATKLCSDRCFIAGNHLAGKADTRFAVVRYGNVIGSRGSVVEHFRRLVAKGVTRMPITDERMTRFLITLRQGVDFVLDRLEHMSGGEIFVPRIPSARIVDLARAVAPGCDFEEIGIRPGEKLHEVLIPFDEASHTLEFERHYTIYPFWNRWAPDERRSDKGETGRPVDADFHYWSKGNEWVLSARELETLLAQEHKDARALEPAA